MRDAIEERYERFRDDVSERIGMGQPDGRNPGIGATESAIAFFAAIAGTFVARELMEATWRTSLDRDPPKNPASHEVAWKEALLWGAASGAIVGIARIASRRVSSGIVRSYRS